MREIVGDLWRVQCDALVIPTNGAVNARGEAVMGRGVALQAKRIDPSFPKRFGRMLKDKGNHVFLHSPIYLGDPYWITFPVKHHWSEPADLNLLYQSLMELCCEVARIEEEAESQGEPSPITTVALPRVGCGNGGLSWSDIRPRLTSILDDRYVVVSTPQDVRADQKQLEGL